MVRHIVASSAETIGAFNTGFDTVSLHRPAVRQTMAPNPAEASVPGGYLYPRMDPDLHALHWPLPELHAVQFEYSR